MDVTGANVVRDFRRTTWPGVTLDVSTERIPHDVEWVDEHDDRHLLIVNLGGTISHLDATLAGGGKYLGPPSFGDMSIIPAGRRFGGVYRGTVARLASVFVDPWCLSESNDDASAFDVRAELAIRDPLIHALVLELTRIGESEAHRSLHGDTLARALIVHVSQRNSAYPLTPRSPARALPASTVRRLQEYVAENLHERIRLADLAGVAMMPLAPFPSAFRATFGTTPHRWVMQERLRRARWLLAHTTCTLARIAAETGFAHQSHFSGAFKADTGTSPGRFRSHVRRDVPQP